MVRRRDRYDEWMRSCCWGCGKGERITQVKSLQDKVWFAKPACRYMGDLHRQQDFRKSGQHAMDDTLKRYRESINNIDAALVFMLAERFKVTQAVGEYKARNQLPPADPGREKEQIARLRQLASDARLDPEFSEKFLRFIIDEVIRHHEQIIEKSG